MADYKLTTPLSDEDISKLRAGDNVQLSGVIYTARDAAHKRMLEALEKTGKFPFDIKGQIIYFVGPTPTKEGMIIGSAGPTTSYRMDPYSPKLIELGLKGMIGKGGRSQEVIDACVKHKAVYFGATGGAAALIAKKIKECEIIAYDDLGPEAVRRLVVEDFPVIVINDVTGADQYKIGRAKYARS
jgi:fumarate hydratase subunit beta